jgi:hypothetical protein
MGEFNSDIISDFLVVQQDGDVIDTKATTDKTQSGLALKQRNTR